MPLQVLGTGFGRTGTMSLKLALEELGVGPCHHMKEVISNPEQVRLWTEAAAGRPDFGAIFEGFQSAVDWPVAAFWPQVLATSTQAKLILPTRSAESWFSSFSETILAVLLARDRWPEPARPWFEMAYDVVINRSLGGRTDRASLIAAFEANEAATRAAVPADRLLVFEARHGWEPLCAFLGKPVPSRPFPRTNTKDEFFKLVEAETAT